MAPVRSTTFAVAGWVNPGTTHFLSRADVETEQGEVQGRRSRAHGDGVSGTEGRGHARLEGLHDGTLDEEAAAQDGRDGLDLFLADLGTASRIMGGAKRPVYHRAPGTP